MFYILLHAGNFKIERKCKSTWGELEQDVNTAAKKELTRDCFNWEMTQMSWCFSEPIKICFLINEQ
jgi:hypothetical protein